MSKNDKNIEEEIKEVKDLEDELEEFDDLDEPKEVTMMDMLNRIVVCLIIIAIILAVNTTVLILKNNNSSSDNTNKSSTSDNSSSQGNSTTTNYDVSMMNEVDLAGALKLFDDKDKTYVLYIGRPDCSACVSYLPALQDAQENLGYTTQYLNLNNIDTKSDDYSKFSKKLSVKYQMTESGKETTKTFGEWIGYTPMTIIIKNGKMVDGEIGSLNYSTLVNLLKNNGIE